MHLIVRHVTGLIDFAGRESRRQFWPWMLIVYGAQASVGLIVAIPNLAGMRQGMMPLAEVDKSVLKQHPELVAGLMQGVIAPGMRVLLLWVAVMALAAALLTGAAVARRLHDSGRSGWRAAPVFASHVALPLLLLSAMPGLIAALGALRPTLPRDQIKVAMAGVIKSFGWLSLAGLAVFAGTVVLIVFLSLRGTDGANRYGGDPLAAD